MKKFASILMAAAMLLCIAGCSLFSKADMVKLGDYEHTIEIAAETGYVSKEDIEVLKEWRKDPANWKK